MNASSLSFITICPSDYRTLEQGIREAQINRCVKTLPKQFTVVEVFPLGKVFFANYIFHFPLMKVEVSAETLGLLETLNIIYTILTRVTFLFFNMFPSPGYKTIYKIITVIISQ